MKHTEAEKAIAQLTHQLGAVPETSPDPEILDLVPTFKDFYSYFLASEWPPVREQMYGRYSICNLNPSHVERIFETAGQMWRSHPEWTADWPA